MSDAQPKLVQFCTPQADVIVALDDTGQLWQRERDQAPSSIPGRPAYKWHRIAGPRETYDAEIEAQVDVFRKALGAAKAASPKS